jgi:uncharacterized membrane protein YedE/YeeE
MADINPWMALLGGVLIGLASWLLLILNGRVAGISGIFGGLLPPRLGEVGWRVLFLAGLIGGVAIHHFAVAPERGITLAAGWPLVIVAGLLVGMGTGLSGGCTSGHGICGISRLSVRSIVATCTFVGVAAATVLVVRHAVGG